MLDGVASTPNEEDIAKHMQVFTTYPRIFVRPLDRRNFYVFAQPLRAVGMCRMCVSEIVYGL